MDGTGRVDAAGPQPETERAVLDLLARRVAGASICPSEAARAVGGAQWRSTMRAVRAAAARLQARGEAEVTQRGRVVDPAEARGPVRIRRPTGTVGRDESPA